MSRLMLCRPIARGMMANKTSCQTSSNRAQYYGLGTNNGQQSLSRQQGPFSAMTSVRSMYSERSLRMDSLDILRQDKVRIFDSGKDRYIERVRKYIEQGETQSVVKEDLINIIGLAETQEHLDLIEQMILSPSMRSHLEEGPWGSILMRLYYRLNEIDRACKNVKDTEKFGNFFIQYAAFRVIMTLLFKSGRYEEVIELHNLACEKITIENFTRQRQLDVLALAACARMNTPESLSIAEKIYTKSSAYEQTRHLKTRLDSLFVYLAINLNEPAKALNHLTGDKLRNNVFLPYVALKTMALMKLNRYEDIVINLREAMQAVERVQKILPQELAELVRENKDLIEDEQVRQDLIDIMAELKENNMLDDRSLESIVFNEIETREGGINNMQQSNQMNQMNKARGGDVYQQDRRQSNNYNSDNHNHNDNYNNRPYRQNNRGRDDRYESRGPRDDSRSFDTYDDQQTGYQNRRRTYNSNNNNSNYRGRREHVKSYLDDGDDNFDSAEFGKEEKRFR